MSFTIRPTTEALVISLRETMTIRHAQDLGVQLASALTSGRAVHVETAELEDVDTSILQLLCSLRKTAAEFTLGRMSVQFSAAVDRCGLRRELFSGMKELL